MVLNSTTPLGTLNLGVSGPDEGAQAICLTAPSIRLLRIKPAALLPKAVALLKPRAAGPVLAAGALPQTAD